MAKVKILAKPALLTTAQRKKFMELKKAMGGKVIFKYHGVKKRRVGRPCGKAKKK